MIVVFHDHTHLLFLNARRDGSVLDINAICADLGQKCMQLLCMYALSGCDTTSYPYDKGISNSFEEDNF